MIGGSEGDVPFILASIEINLRLGQIIRDRVPSQQDITSAPVPKSLLELVEEGLVAQAPAIDLVVDARAFRPRLARVVGLVDGEVGEGVVVGKVVFPCREEGVVAAAVGRVQEQGSRVEGSGDGVVGRRREDCDVGKGLLLLARVGWCWCWCCEGGRDEACHGDERGEEVHR